ncbi:MAG TPA: hypothetical protein VN848_08410 [Gemmatimonadales bacterium]|nr:hypothetical protein [Gemmatimonadales bacterium]
MVTSTRLIADRRRGVDRRATPRRYDVGRPPAERRRKVDRRHGAERRSTLDRRGRFGRQETESPGEHLRNALQLLDVLRSDADLDSDHLQDLSAALDRLRSALRLLEHKGISPLTGP